MTIDKDGLASLVEAGHAIDAARKRRGLTTRQLAIRAGWNRSALERARLGLATTYDAVADMAAAVGLRIVFEPADDLLPLSLDGLRRAVARKS